MNSTPPLILTDQACLHALPRRAGAEHFEPLVRRYLPPVYSSALRRTGDAVQATVVTRAVFLVLARRARKLRKQTVLAGWLFDVTALTCRKLPRPRRWFWFRRPPHAALSLDAALDRLSPKQRHAVLLLHLLNYDGESAAAILRTTEQRARKRAVAGLKKMARLLTKDQARVESGGDGKWWAGKAERASLPPSSLNEEREEGGQPNGPPPSIVPVEVESLALACSAEGCTAPLPEGLALDLLQVMEASRGRRPVLQLARRTLNSLAFTRWRRRLAIGIPSFLLLLALLAGAIWKVSARDGHSRLFSTIFVWSMHHQARTVPGLSAPARPWPTNASAHVPMATDIRTAGDMYQTTNIWQAHLKFSPEQWKALEPKHINPLPHFFQPDGTILLRNPQARRSGLAGVLGFDFPWAQADFEFGGVSFTNVAARIKGNGTYLSSLVGAKRSFKVDLNKFSKGQKLGGTDELDFHNLIDDYSSLSDALGYEFFRDAGVPAPRTAYAWLTVSVTGQSDHQPLGLYAMIEPVGGKFAAEHFGSKKAPIFKPVTYQLFEHLGDDWSAYAPIYDLKTQATPEQERRVMDFARLVSQADDAEFDRRVGDFLDLQEFAGFLAGEVLLSAYDGFLSDGQNFYVYLDPRSDKFGFIPWDLDLAWGGFFLLGSILERERASLWHPWVGQNRFLERVMAVEEFRQIYRARLEDFSTRLLEPGRLHRRIDELASLIRSPIAAESAFRLGKFEQAVSDQPLPPADGKNEQGANRPAHQLKCFIEQRARSVRRQLDGQSTGVILHHSRR